MAYAFERGAREAGGETIIKHIRQIKPAEIKSADVIVIATPDLPQKAAIKRKIFHERHRKARFGRQTCIRARLL